MKKAARCGIGVYEIMVDILISYTLYFRHFGLFALRLVDKAAPYGLPCNGYVPEHTSFIILGSLPMMLFYMVLAW